MKFVALALLSGSICIGCDSRPTPPGSAPEEKTPHNVDAKKPTGNTPPAKKANPLVGKWMATKSNEHWAGNVSSKAVIEFLNDGETMRITQNNNITADAYYIWQGKDFFFHAKFQRPDGNNNAYGGLVSVTKLTDDEIVGDVFTLKRVK